MSIFVNDRGHTVVLDTGLDITFADTFEIHVTKPNGHRVVWTGSQFETTKIQYMTQRGDLSLPGDYTLQAYVASGNSTRMHGGPVILTVLEKS